MPEPEAGGEAVSARSGKEMPLTDATLANGAASGANADAAFGSRAAGATNSVRAAHAHNDDDDDAVAVSALVADTAAQSALPATGFDAAINSADKWAKTTDECAGRARSTAAESSGTAHEYERWYNTMMEVVGGCVLIKSGTMKARARCEEISQLG